MKAIMAIRTATMAAALVAAGFAAGAQPGPGDGPGFGEHRPPMERMLGAHGRWWNDPQVADKLKLTDDQRKQMDDIMQEHREKLIDMRGSVEKAEVAMEPLMSADQPNESAILSQIDKIAQARAELEKANARFLLALRAKLTPDQWKQLQALHSQRREGRGHDQMHRRDWRNSAPGSPEGTGNAPPPGPGPQSSLDQGPDQGPGPNQPAEIAAGPESGTIH